MTATLFAKYSVEAHFSRAESDQEMSHVLLLRTHKDQMKVINTPHVCASVIASGLRRHKKQYLKHTLCHTLIYCSVLQICGIFQGLPQAADAWLQIEYNSYILIICLLFLRQDCGSFPS